MLRVFNDTRMLQYTAGSGTISKEFSPIFLSGYRQADSVLRHSNRTVADQAIEAECGNMKNIIRRKNNRVALQCGSFIRRSLVFVIKLTV